MEAGQKAVIKVHSFPFTRYGTVEGKVMIVSRDAVDDREAATFDPKASAGSQSASSVVAKNHNFVFPTTIALNKTVITVEGKAIPLSPGMAVTVEVLTGQRRALDYILSPLSEVASNSGHER